MQWLYKLLQRLVCGALGDQHERHDGVVAGICHHDSEAVLGPFANRGHLLCAYVNKCVPVRSACLTMSLHITSYHRRTAVRKTCQ